MTVLQALRRETGAALCLECGKCSSMCPLAPFGDFSAARTLSLHDPESDIPHYADAVERCLTCGSCEVRCPQGVRYAEFVRGLRPELPAQLRRPQPHGGVFQSAARLAGSGDTRRRPVWLDQDLRVADSGEIGLFVGCLPRFDVVFAESFGVRSVAGANAAIRILNTLDIEPVIVPDELCCGHDLLWGGDVEAFAALAAANCERFKSLGIECIVTVCAECSRTWRLDYPAVVSDYRPKVEYLAEFLAERLDRGDAIFRGDGEDAVTYQDPCRLGRHLGVVDEPRRVLAAVPELHLVEMGRSGRDALCCGTPGFIHCDNVSRQLQIRRLQQAAATGATKLLTACPKCLLHFHCAQTEDRRHDEKPVEIVIEDLAVFLAHRLVTAPATADTAASSASPTGRQS